MAETILVIDDEADLVRLLDYNLTQAGYVVLSAGEGESGIDLARRHAPDLIVLDVMLPGVDGWDVCKRLRSDPATAGIPILMLTARGQESDRILGLELGADDYVSKPFSVRELLARIKALRRRASGGAQVGEVVRVGEIVIDSGKMTASAGGKALTLTLTEFNLLRALATRPGRVFARDALISAARGDDANPLDRTIDVHVASLRKKLGRRGRLIETVRGVGYRLRE